MQPITYCTMECAPDVLERLKLLIPEAKPRQPWEPDMSLLTGIPIIPREDWAPGTYKLTRHDSCKVDVEARDVTHEECSVVQEGVINGL